MIHLPSPSPAPAPIVIIGMPQSGTTFLASCLHDQGVPMCGANGFHDEKHHECADIHGILGDHLRAHPPAIKYPKTGDAQVDRYIKTIDPAITDDLRRALVAYRRGREVYANGQPWGVKNPSLALLYKAAFGCFGGAMFICCVRCAPDAASAAYWKEIVDNPHARQISYLTIYRQVIEHAVPERVPLFMWSYSPRMGHDVQEAALSKWLGREVRYAHLWQEAKWCREQMGGHE